MCHKWEHLTTPAGSPLCWVQASAPGARRLQPAAARLLIGVKCELFPPWANTPARTASHVSQLWPDHKASHRQEGWPTPSYQYKGSQWTEESLFFCSTSLAEGKIRICPRSCKKQLELQIKCKKHGYQSHFPLTIRAISCKKHFRASWHIKAVSQHTLHLSWCSLWQKLY